MCGMGGLDGVADQPTLEDHGKDYRINMGGTRGEEALRPEAKDSVYMIGKPGHPVTYTSGIKGIDSHDKLSYLSDSLAD